jgi:hypothetical protein
MVRLLRHRQTKGAATDRLYLRPPRHIFTLPKVADQELRLSGVFCVWERQVLAESTRSTQLGRASGRNTYFRPTPDLHGGPAKGNCAAKLAVRFSQSVVPRMVMASNYPEKKSR